MNGACECQIGLGSTPLLWLGRDLSCLGKVGGTLNCLDGLSWLKATKGRTSSKE